MVCHSDLLPHPPVMHPRTTSWSKRHIGTLSSISFVALVLSGAWRGLILQSRSALFGRSKKGTCPQMVVGRHRTRFPSCIFVPLAFCVVVVSLQPLLLFVPHNMFCFSRACPTFLIGRYEPRLSAVHVWGLCRSKSGCRASRFAWLFASCVHHMGM